MITEKVATKPEINIFPTREDMGIAAARSAGKKIQDLLKSQPEVNVIFAAAPSQNEFLVQLQLQDIDWSRVNAFHMDEYIGLDKEAPQGFGNFLRDRIFGKQAFKAVYYLDGNAADIEAECQRYAALLAQYPTDVVCMGIGENGHIAFNDPPVADFNDPHLVKVVELEAACRQQQVNDGCFDYIDEVPTHALTLTVPALVQPQAIFCVVPGPAKATAVYNTLNQPVVEAYPSTILREHNNCQLYLDADSAKLLKQ